MQCSTEEAPITMSIGCEQRCQLTEYFEEKFSQEKPPYLDMVRDEANENMRQSLARNDNFVDIRNADVTAGHCKKCAPKYRDPYRVSRVYNKKYI